MLGSMRISSEKEFNNELPVFSTLVNGKGYESGNPISLKVWDISTQSLIPFEYTMIDPYNEAYMKNTYPEEDGLYSIVKFTKGVNNIENVEERKMLEILVDMLFKFKAGDPVDMFNKDILSFNPRSASMMKKLFSLFFFKK